MISVIIPSRNEPYLNATISDIFTNFTGEFEVIAVVDGSEYSPVIHRDRLKVIYQPLSGIRPSINRAVEISIGDYILKTDSHCSFCKGFDETLLRDIQDNWVVVARRYTLDLDSWTPHPRSVDYYYLSCPWTHPRGTLMMQSCPWISRTEAVQNTQTDDLMCFQGSMWMMSRKHWDKLGGLETGNEAYVEHHEISFKTWFSGDRVVINKNTWYAHPAKGGRGYNMDINEVYRDHDLSARRWTKHTDFPWLIDKFWPLPTEINRHRIEKYYWPYDWRKYL